MMSMRSCDSLKHDFVTAHVRRALRHFVQFDLDARARARRRFARRTRQTRRAHVLHARDRAGGEQFQARFAHQLFHERIADLHRAALLLGGFLGQILRGKRRARQAIATRRRADVKDRIAHALGRAARDLFVAQHAEAKRVHQRIALVAFVEINFARDGRNAEAIAVMRDAADHAGEKPAIVGMRFRADCPSMIGPKRSELIAQTGRAPIVKISRMMPPTPVAAP